MHGNKDKDDQQDILTRHRGKIAVSFCLAISVGLALFVIRRPEAPALNVVAPAERESIRPVNAAPLISIYVSGEVNAPGVYSLRQGALISDAIHAAGGARLDSGVNHLNLSDPITPYGQIVVPTLVLRQNASWVHEGDMVGAGEFEQTQPHTAATIPRALPTGSGASPHSARTHLIDINSADKIALATLPGIGPVLADRIISYRLQNGRFDAVDGLLAIKGIGVTKLDKIRPFITVGQ